MVGVGMGFDGESEDVGDESVRGLVWFSLIRSKAYQAWSLIF